MNRKQAQAAYASQGLSLPPSASNQAINWIRGLSAGVGDTMEIETGLFVTFIVDGANEIVHHSQEGPGQALYPN